MKTIITILFSFITSVVFAQKLTFEIKNDSVVDAFSIRKITNELVENIYVKEHKSELNSVNFEKGYYLLQKDEKSALIYLKPSDDIKISLDAEKFYSSIAFSGKGVEINNYLRGRFSGLLDKKGRKKKYYKKSFYKGDENAYLSRVDALYKDYFGTLFSSQLDEEFVNEEMKDLQYGYALDLLKFEDARKYYKFKDTLEVSKFFLEPLTHIHFDNSQLFEQYHSYQELSVLKWKKDIENMESYPLMEEVLNSIRTTGIKDGVLQSMYSSMLSDKERAGDFYKLVKTNSSDVKLLARMKDKYDEIRQIVAGKNLSKFTFRNRNEEEVTLANFKGNYIFLSVWASWCEPCIKQLEAYKMLKEKYAKHAIVFVGVSVDKGEMYENWKTTVNEHNLEGEQLFFDGPKSKIIKTYDISSIPGFVLLSLKGEKMDLNINDPSSEKTTKILDDLFVE